jgi:hypothetical protein
MSALGQKADIEIGKLNVACVSQSKTVEGVTNPPISGKRPAVTWVFKEDHYPPGRWSKTHGRNQKALTSCE